LHVQKESCRKGATTSAGCCSNENQARPKPA
jgi:hypothetical protein